MVRGTRTVDSGERNKGLSSTFQPSEEGPKRCDKHGDKNEDNSPKNVNNVHLRNIDTTFVGYLMSKPSFKKNSNTTV